MMDRPLDMSSEDRWSEDSCGPRLGSLRVDRPIKYGPKMYCPRIDRPRTDRPRIDRPMIDRPRR